MADQVQARPIGAPRAPGVQLGAGWWAMLAVTAVGLGLLGMSGRGFLSVALWSVVGFVVGSLVAIALSARVRPSMTGVAR